MRELEPRTAETVALDKPFGAEAMEPRDFYGLRVATMTIPQYSRWIDLGRPPLAPAPEPQQKQQQPADDVARIVGEVNAAIGTLCDVVAQETATAEKALREEIGALRARVTVLEGQLPQLNKHIEDMRGQTLDLPMLPSMRSAGARHEH
jgi:hypothetical protein